MNCLQKKKKLNQASSSTKREGSERKEFLKLNRKKAPFSGRTIENYDAMIFRSGLIGCEDGLRE